jgi:hypothetical protein
MKGKKFLRKFQSRNSIRRNIVAHIAHSWEEAESWDFKFWLRQTPDLRISALESIRKDYEAIRNGNNKRL